MLSRANVSSGATSEHGELFAVGILILAVIAYAATDGMVKWLSASYPVLEITFFRSIFTFIPAAAVIAQCGGIPSLRTNRLRLHLLRAAFGSAAMLLYFFSYSMLPMADVTTLGQTYPLILVALSWLLLGDRASRGEWLAVAAGFLSVIVIVDPGSSVFDWRSLLPLLGSACMAGFVILLRFLSATESRASLLVYVPLLTSAWTGASLNWVWTAPRSTDWLLLLVMGVVGGVGFHFRNLAYSSARPATLAPIEYLHILFASAIGIVVFGNFPSWQLLIGAGMLVASNLYVVRSQHRRQTVIPAPADPHKSEGERRRYA